MATNTVVMSKVMKLIEKVEKIDSALDEKHGIDNTIGTYSGNRLNQTRNDKPNMAEQELYRLLISLNKNQIIDIETIMYFGRGGIGAESLTDLRTEMEDDFESKKLTAENIIEKGISVTVYFNDAIKKAKVQKINLNKF